MPSEARDHLPAQKGQVREHEALKGPDLLVHEAETDPSLRQTPPHNENDPHSSPFGVSWAQLGWFKTVDCNPVHMTSLLDMDNLGLTNNSVNESERAF